MNRVISRLGVCGCVGCYGVRVRWFAQGRWAKCGRRGRARTFQAPHPARPARARAAIILPPRVESRLTSTRWRARRRRTEAQASAFGNAPSSSLLLVTAPGRVARGGARRALRARLVQDAPASCWPNSWGGGLPLDPFGRAREQRASRVAGGDFLHLGQGNPTQRTAQGRRVGALGSKLRSLGVAG